MAFTKNLFFGFTFTISFALVYLWFIRTESDVDLSSFSNTQARYKKPYHHVNKMQSHMDLKNSKRIDRIIKSEQLELQERGVYIDITDYKQTKHKLISNKGVKSLEPNNNSHNSQHIPIKRRFKYRNPEKDDFQKLNKVQLNIEHETDPLPESANCANKVFLLVLVVSQPENEERRRYIRDSWASSYAEDIHKLKSAVKPFLHGLKFTLENVFRTVFVMGKAKGGNTVMKKVLEEARLNKDIVFGSLQEDYQNLTMKTRLGLKWAYYECESVYVVKTDDDVFINPVPLVEWLKEMPLQNVYTGYCNFNSPVVRTKGNKWYVSYDDFKGENYPGYCLGGGYLMSEDVLGRFLKLSYGRQLFPMEDLYVGLIIKELETVKVNDQRRHFDLIYSGRSNLCDMNNLFLAHQVIGRNQLVHIKKARHALETC